jgi:hypothetical protein
MADETVTQQIVREAPEIEAYKLKLLQEAQNLAFNVNRTPLSQQLPGYQVAGFSPAQLAAIQATEQQGVGAFTPYMTAANKALGSAYATTGEAADVLRGADTRKQFTDAQLAMQQAGGAAANISAGIKPIEQGLGALGAASQRALAADTSGRFAPAYQDINTGLGSLATAQNMAALSSQANLQPATAAIGQGLSGLTEAQRMAASGMGADFSGSQNLLQQAAGQTAGTAPEFGLAAGVIGQGLGTGQQAIGMASQAAMQPGFGAAQAALMGGIGTLGGATGRFDPSSTASFMDPYRQQVIDEAMKQINRQGALAQENLAAQAIRAGAYGGEREGIQRAELERGLMEQKANTIANLLSQGYGQAQANAMASFEQQQQRQAAAGQGIGQMGAQFGQLASQQGALGQQAAQLAAQQAGLGVQAGSQLGNLEAQRAQLGLSAAGQLANIGQTVGQQAAQQAQLAQSGAGLYGNLAQQQVAAGQGLGQLGVQQAQLGQGAAGQYMQAAQQYGNLASQQGALAGQEAAINQNIANLLGQQAGLYGQLGGQAANIYGQQGQQFQGLGQGIGQLAGQQFGIGQQTAQGLGALAGQLGQLGVQQGALGQTAQALQQGDINFLYNVGQAQQAFNQQTLDAQRATEMQKIYAPYQQAGFLSDIYKGAPSSQMSTQVASQPSASPFQQAVGIGLGALSTAAGAQKAGMKLF